MGLLSSYGAVPVSGRNMYRLMGNGEVVLLYPGGVREAYKRKGEEYQLIWPARPEVIRMAARFNATIVPLSAIGADDGVELALDGPELLKLPIIGDRVREFAQRMPGARTGTNVSEEVDDTFISPVPNLLKARPPQRFYFLFGKPMVTCKEDMQDPARVERMYKELKEGVEGGISYLLRKRQEDPYADFAKRMLYEASWGWKKKAPTFEP